MLRYRFSPPYLCRRGPPNSSLAVYCLSTDRSLFPLPFAGIPFVLAGFEIDVVSRVTLLTWPGQGYGRHWLFFRALSSFCILSVVGCCIVFKVIWIFVLYICIPDSWSRYCIYLFLGFH